MSLPNGVQELQWVKANGNVYLNTTFNPNQNTRVVADVEWDASATTSWLFGARNGKNRGAFAFLTYKSAYRADYGSATKTLSVLPSGRFTVEMDKNVVKINGETVATASSQNFTTNYPMVLFANNTAGTISGYTTAKLYSLKIYDNSTLVRDYIPVRSTSGSTAGLIALYDAVHNIVHGPSGSGDFEAGPEKTEDQAHKALIDGTARDVTSGTCLVGGTAYAIKKGRTLVGGTGYDIVLSTSGFTVTITGNGMHGSAVRAAVIINGTTYTSAATVEVESGTTIMLHTYAASKRDYAYTKITIDGVTVAKGTSSGTASYNYTVNKNIAVELSMRSGLSSSNAIGVIDVTTS